MISNYQTTTAVAVASTEGALNTLTGSVIPLVPTFLPFITVLFFLLAPFFGFRWFGLGVVALLATILVVPASRTFSEVIGQGSELLANWRGEAYVVAAIVLILIILFARGEDGDELAAGIVFLFIAGIYVAALAGLYVLAAYAYPSPGQQIAHIQQELRRVWLPPEAIGLSDEERVVGYVLEIESGWAIVLKEEDRTITYYNAQDIRNRQVCRLGSPEGLPLRSASGAFIPDIPECFSNNSEIVSGRAGVKDDGQTTPQIRQPPP